MQMNVMEEIGHGQKDWAFALAVQAYIWGFPLVQCWLDRLKKTPELNSGSVVNVSELQINRLRHVRQLSTRESSEFVNAATDFLYSTAVIDLSDGPLYLDSPAIADRWYGIQVLDARMNTLRNIGTRRQGDQASRGILALAHHALEPAPEVEVIRSDNPHLYIVARLEVDPDEAMAPVHAMQDGMRLSPVDVGASAQQRAGQALIDSYAQLTGRRDDGDAALNFFHQLAVVLEHVPPRADEGMMTGLLAELGVTAGRFNAAGLPEAVLQGLREAVPYAQAILARKIFEVGSNVNGWAIVKDIGRYQYDYIIRALVAKHGIWANIPEESMYFMAWTDYTGAVLHGANQYEIVFPPQGQPPVKAFWSISYYDDQGRIIANRLNRNAIHSKYSDLQPAEDGSVRIVISQECPDDLPENNWLPAHDGVFNLNLRCYYPGDDLLALSYDFPLIRAIG
ncbi:MAG: DUF1254 domain-containing protein [Wenzhouxiangellaceae bacterium]